MYYYSSYGTRKLLFNAVDHNNFTIPEVRFYVMDNTQFSETAQFACTYFVCDALTLASNATPNSSDSIFGTYVYYHVFAVQRQNGIDRIIGYELLPPATELLSVRVD